eukprot:SAG22_NODE_1248_length_5014_cov_9.812004_6_plen_211_part_00
MGCGASSAAADAKPPQNAAAGPTASPGLGARTRKGSVMDEIDAMEHGFAMVVNVQAWLESLDMAAEYWPKFEAAGYDDLEIVADMKEDELKADVGVEKVGHLKKLLKEITKLKSARRASSVSDMTSPNGARSAVKPGSKPGEATVLSFKGSDHCLSLCFSVFPCSSAALTEDRCNHQRGAGKGRSRRRSRRWTGRSTCRTTRRTTSGRAW